MRGVRDLDREIGNFIAVGVGFNDLARCRPDRPQLAGHATPVYVRSNEGERLIVGKIGVGVDQR